MDTLRTEMGKANAILTAFHARKKPPKKNKTSWDLVKYHFSNKDLIHKHQMAAKHERCGAYASIRDTKKLEHALLKYMKDVISHLKQEWHCP